MTDVATNYFILTGALRQLETVRAISAAHDETLRLVTARHRAGLATPFDVERAQTDASRARAAIPPLETLVAVSRHRIAVLIGDQAFNAASIVPSSSDVVVPVAQPGQPATLLQRRPDLLALNAQLDAANSRRQQAHAEWFPRLFLGALFGRESVEVNGLNLGSARFTNVVGLLTMPIFNWGRTRAINDIAESNQVEALLRYEDGIVRALEDVENTLVALRDERQRAQLLQSASASAEAALGRAQSLYDRGQIDLLPLLDAQRTRLTVRVSANDSQTQLLLDSVQLYKALGGGWQVFEPANPPDRKRLTFAQIMKPVDRYRTAMKTSITTALLAVPIAALLSACSEKPATERPRAVRTAEVRYDKSQETNRYVGTVQSRHEVNEAFRVGGKIVQRKVDVGQKVGEGDVLAVLDDTDYRQAEEAARQNFVATTAQARQAESDRKRLEHLRTDGSVSVSDDEKARTSHETAIGDRRGRGPAARAGAQSAEVHRAARIAHRCSHRGALRIGTGRRRRPIDCFDCQRGRARDRRRCTGGSPERIQGVPLQGMAPKRARADIRRRVARAFAASSSGHANLPRALEAGGSAFAAARRDRHARRRALGR